MESNTHIFFVVALGILGMLFGSFSSVLIHRWKEHKSGIFTGRSECPKCGHTLTAIELIPLLSYIIQRAQCKKCHSPIPIFYPLLEIGMGIWFMIAGAVMIRLSIDPISLGALWILILFFITALYVIYDILYMEIPDQALVPGIIGAILILVFSSLHSVGKDIFFPYVVWMDGYTIGIYGLLGAWSIYTFFYFQILIPGAIYLIKRGRFVYLIDLFLSYFLLPIHILSYGKIFPEKLEKDEPEIPSWIGGGDLRIGLFVGLTLGLYHSIFALGISYIVGALFGVLYIIATRDRKAMVPFGPFLALGWVITLLFYKEISNVILSIVL